MSYSSFFPAKVTGANGMVNFLGWICMRGEAFEPCDLKKKGGGGEGGINRKPTYLINYQLILAL